MCDVRYDVRKTSGRPVLLITILLWLVPNLYLNDKRLPVKFCDEVPTETHLKDVINFAFRILDTQ